MCVSLQNGSLYKDLYLILSFFTQLLVLYISESEDQNVLQCKVYIALTGHDLFTELRTCVKDEVDILGSMSFIVCTDSMDMKQQ